MSRAPPAVCLTHTLCLSLAARRSRARHLPRHPAHTPAGSREDETRVRHACIVYSISSKKVDMYPHTSRVNRIIAAPL